MSQLKNELKLMCPQCHERVATVRRLRNSVDWVYCEACDAGRSLEDWLGWKQHELGLLECGGEAA